VTSRFMFVYMFIAVVEVHVTKLRMVVPGIEHALEK